MKIKNVPGEVAFKALFVNNLFIGDSLIRDGWRLSRNYYFSEEEVKCDANRFKSSYKWPVEIWENGTIYIPSKEELQEETT